MTAFADAAAAYKASRALDQRPAAVLAAATREGFEGPVFIQGDHIQVSRSKYLKDAASEVGAIREYRVMGVPSN